MPAIVNLTPAIPACTTPIYRAVVTDGNGDPVPGSLLDTLTLTIADVSTRSIINGVEYVNILNTGRGTVDEEGNLAITLEVGDTTMDELLPYNIRMVKRALIVDWTYNNGQYTGRHQANFIVTSLVENCPV